MATRKMFHGEYILFKDKNKWVPECLAQAKGFHQMLGFSNLGMSCSTASQGYPFWWSLAKCPSSLTGIVELALAKYCLHPIWSMVIYKPHFSFFRYTGIFRYLAHSVSLGVWVSMGLPKPGFKSPDRSPGLFRVSWQLQALSVAQKLRQHLFLLTAALPVGWLLLQTSCSRSQWVFSEGWILSGSFGRGGIIAGDGDLLWDLSSCLVFLSLHLWVFPARLGRDLPG